MKRAVSAGLLIAWCGAPLAMQACSGDDTIVFVDAGSRDATTTDAEAGADAPADGACMPYEAGARDDAGIAAGYALIKSHKCQQCHGDQLSGNNDGVKATYGTAYPPNLTGDPATGLGCWSDDQIVNAILHGIDNQGMPLCPPMPTFGTLADGGLDPASAAHVVEYLRSLPPTVNQVPNTDCSGAGDAGEAGSEAGSEAGPEAGSDASDAAPDAGGEASTDAPDDVADDAPADAPADVTDSAVESGDDGPDDAGDSG